MSAKPKPKTPAQLAAERVRLNCAIGRDVVSGVATPSRLNRTEYAMFILFHAISELADLIPELADASRHAVPLEWESLRIAANVLNSRIQDDEAALPRWKCDPERFEELSNRLAAFKRASAVLEAALHNAGAVARQPGANSDETNQL